MPSVRPLILEIATAQTPESLVEQLAGQRGIVLLRSAGFDLAQARYSFVTARPFLTFRSFGSQCEIGSAVADTMGRRTDGVPESPNPPPQIGGSVQFGNS